MGLFSKNKDALPQDPSQVCRWGSPHPMMQNRIHLAPTLPNWPRPSAQAEIKTPGFLKKLVNKKAKAKAATPEDSTAVLPLSPSQPEIEPTIADNLAAMTLSQPEPSATAENSAAAGPAMEVRRAPQAACTVTPACGATALTWHCISRTAGLGAARLRGAAQAARCSAVGPAACVRTGAPALSASHAGGRAFPGHL
jgi:hypothetical protein